MKKLILGVSLIAALVLAQTASADSRSSRRGYDRHVYSSNYYPRSNPYRFGSSRRYSSRSYFPSSHSYLNYRGGSHIGFSYGSYSGRRGYRRHNDFDYLLGGIVLGSLLSYPSYREPVTRIREIVYVKESSPRTTTAATGRHLLKDLEGNCFERVTDEDGNEVRIQLEASECSF